jgi:preprotein translocase subunit SecG
MECPNCKLNNPPGSVRCDCGYDFQAGSMPGPPPLPNSEGLRASPLKILLGLVLIALQLLRPDYGFSSESGAEALGYNFAAAAFYAAGAYLIYKGLGSPSILVTFIFSCLALTLAFILQRSQHVDLAVSLGATTGAAILSSIVVGIYYKVRKRQWTKERIVSIMCFWTLIIALYRYNPGLSQQDVSRIMAEAAGRATISQPDNDAARIVRNLFREVIALRQEATEAGPKFQTPEMEHLLEPVSFSSREMIEETLKQLNTLEELSYKLAQAPKILLQHLQAARLQLSGSPYASFLQKFEDGFAKGIGRNADIHQKEGKFLASEIDLYQFVLQHFARFSVRGGQLLVADDATLNQYNAKLASVRQLAQDYEAARKQFTTQQSELEKNNGLSLSDLDPSAKK